MLSYCNSSFHGRGVNTIPIHCPPWAPNRLNTELPAVEPKMGCGGSKDHAATELWLESRRRERERRSQTASSAPMARRVDVRDAPREFGRIFSRPPVANPPSAETMLRVQAQADPTAPPPPPPPGPSTTQQMTIREAGQELQKKFAPAPAERTEQGTTRPDPPASSTGKGPPAASPASSKHQRQEQRAAGGFAASSVVEKKILSAADSGIKEPVNKPGPGQPLPAPGPSSKGQFPARQQKENPISSTTSQQPVTSTPCSHVPGCRCMICQPDAYDGIKLRKTWRNQCAPGCLCPPCLDKSPVEPANVHKSGAKGAAALWRR